MAGTVPGYIEVEKKNFNHFVGDIAWFGVAIPAIGSFLSIYALNLGANAFELGLLASAPSIFLLLSTFITNWWGRRHDTTYDALLWPSLIMRIRILALAFIPFLPPTWRVAGVIAVMSIFAIGSGLSNVFFMVFMQESISKPQFTRLISRRQMVMNLCLAGSTLLLGVWLEKVAFPVNYQVMFVVLFLATLVSLWHILQVRPLPLPDNAPQPTVLTPKPGETAVNPWQDAGYRTLVLMIGIVFIGYYASLPVIPLRLVNDLGATEGFISIYSFLELIGAATMAYFANRIVGRLGYRNMILTGMTITGLAMVILALAPSLTLTLPAALINGMAWVGTDISQFSFFSSRIADNNRRAFNNAYFQVVSISIFIAPLIGSTLASSGLSLTTVLLIGAGLRIAAGFLMSRYKDTTPIQAS